MREVAADIWVIDHFLEADSCSKLIALAEGAGFSEAPINTVQGAERHASVRNNDRVISDDYGLASDLWSRLRSHIPAFLEGRQALCLNERIRFYRYSPGQQFRGHVDNPFKRVNGEESLLTFMVYLNDDYDGGETTFAATTVNPRIGRALIFRHDLFHEGSTVRSGRKYVLRSDVMFNPIGRISG